MIIRHKRYWINQPASKKRYIWMTIVALLIGGGAYSLWIALAPPVYIPPSPHKWNEPVPHKAQITENRLYIPKLKLNLPYKSGDESVLGENAWHRYPERGNPERGGNFILAGHRFELGLTPAQIKQRSPFYHIDKLSVGDEMYVDFNGKRYRYRVTELLKVKPSQIEIEAPTTEAKMTLYTCTLKGAVDGREVIIAHRDVQDVDPSQPF